MGQPLRRCPDCKKEGKKSILHVKAGNFERGQPEIYFDEDERRHVHDPSVNYTVYTCSNGHENTRKSVGKCTAEGCNWEGGKE